MTALTSKRVKAVPVMPSELPILLQFMKDLGDQDGVPFEASSVRSAVEEMLVNHSHGRVWLIARTAEDDFIGYALISYSFDPDFGGRIAHLDAIYILPEQRGRGFGREMVQLIEEHCSEKGINAIQLNVRSRNTRAIEFYANVGFGDQGYVTMTKPITPVRREPIERPKPVNVRSNVL